MYNRYALIPLVLLNLILVTWTAQAGDAPAIRGVVKGTDGKPLAGAEVRAERLGTKGPATVATTNAKGEYTFKGLSLAPYKVTAVVNKVPKSVGSIKTRNSGWVLQTGYSIVFRPARQTGFFPGRKDKESGRRGDANCNRFFSLSPPLDF